MARILVAEDDGTTRTMLGVTLEKMGHFPIYSPDGQHALETLSVDAGISLLITDVMMPRMDGRVLIHLLREMDCYSALPIIVISAVVGPREIAGLLKMGATRFMPKPIDQRAVIECVNASWGIFDTRNSEHQKHDARQQSGGIGRNESGKGA